MRAATDPVERSPASVELDPADAVVRLGLVALSTDLTIERDARRILPPEVALHVSRVAFDNPTTPENLRRMAPRLAAAADLILPGVPLAAIGYGCTSASVAIGDDGVRAAIGSVRPGVPVETPPDAAMAALAALGARRISLLTPYLPETTRPMAAYFERRRLRLAACHCLGLADDREMARVSQGSILAAADAADRPDAEALFLSCTALPAVGMIEALEQRLGKPVVSSNQALFWRLLHHAGVAPARDAPGRLFTLSPAPAA